MLVATDNVAARRLDIDELPHVIQLRVATPRGLRAPQTHRRTGRAGGKHRDIAGFRARCVSGRYRKLIKISVEQIAIAGFEPEADYSTRPPAGRSICAGPTRHARRRAARGCRCASATGPARNRNAGNVRRTVSISAPLCAGSGAARRDSSR